MNAHQRRKAYRMLQKLKRDRVPVLAPPEYNWQRVTNQPKVITTIAAVFRDAGVAHLAHDTSRWPRPVAAHNIRPVPRSLRYGGAHAHA